MRTKWQSGSGCGNAPPRLQTETAVWRRTVVEGEIQPDLSRKINFICCHRFPEFQEGFVLAKNGAEPRSKKKKKNSNVRWIITIFFLTVLISSAISFLSSSLLAASGLVEAFVVLLVIVLIGILFDIIGVAVMSAGEKPFHSMASKKRPGAQEALTLIRNAEKVSSFCNDVVGDICGVVSGSASAVIAVKALTQVDSDTVAQLMMSALVAGVTIAGKACGKNVAMSKSTQIVLLTSKPIYYIKTLFRRKRKK